MADFKPKNIVLHAYNVENVDLNSDMPDIFDVLLRRLNRDESANDRRMKLNSVSSEEDVISDFSINKNSIFCVMMRISPTEEIATIPDSFFKGKTVQLGSSQSNSEPTVTVLNTVYFLVGEKYIVSSLPPSQIKRLQVYLNYLLSFEGKERKKLYLCSCHCSSRWYQTERDEGIYYWRTMSCSNCHIGRRQN